MVEAAQSLISESQKSLHFGGSIGELGNVVLRTTDHAVHDHVEDVRGVETHHDAGSTLENRLQGRRVGRHQIIYIINSLHTVIKEGKGQTWKGNEGISVIFL